MLLAALWLTTKYPQETKEESFIQTGKEVIKDYLTKRMLYSQSVALGILMEQETSFWSFKAVIKVESELPLKEKESVLSAEQETLDSFMKENSNAVESVEEEIYLTEAEEFLPVTEKKQAIDPKEFQEPEAFIKRFFTVDPTTEVDYSLFQMEQLRNIDCTVDLQKEGPQILIYHTHSQEAFADSEPGKEEDTIVGAGEILAENLRRYGYQVYHHKGKYDVESRDYAYSNALPEIENILKENSEIQVVIDLHRDAVADTTRLVTQLQGKPVAKVMFFNGLSRVREKGAISYLENPYLAENLAFSFQMKLACEEYYPGFARSNYLRAYRYNMHLCPKTLLIELGAQTNSKEEIRNALDPLAHVLWLVLSGYSKQ